MDRAAVIADEALAVVALRNARDDFVTADGAEFHVEWKGRGDASVSPGRGILERLRVQAACRAKQGGMCGGKTKSPALGRAFCIILDVGCGGRI